MEVTLEEYKTMLRNHDWYYDYTDDPSVWDAGHIQWKRLKALAKKNPQFENLLKEQFKLKFGNTLTLA